MNTVLGPCSRFILFHHILLAFAPRRVGLDYPPARLDDATPLPHVASVAQELSGEVGAAVATMRLTLAVVVEFGLLLPPITSLPLLDHNFLHSRRLLHHLPRRRLAALNATGVPSVAGSSSRRLRPPASNWLDPSSTPPP